MGALAGQLSRAVLNEMKRRILGTNIKKEKLALNENSDRMKSSFEREIKRYQKRKTTQHQKIQQEKKKWKDQTNGEANSSIAGRSQKTVNREHSFETEDHGKQSSNGQNDGNDTKIVRRTKDKKLIIM